MIGSIGARWLAVGREQFGYPTTDEQDWPGVPHRRISRFQFGNIWWTPQQGAHVQSTRIDPGTALNPVDG